MRKVWGVCVVSFFLFLAACSKEETAEQAVQKYVSNWNEHNYESMYNLLSETAKASITEEEFVNKYTAIYEGIEAKKLLVTVGAKEKKQEKDTAAFAYETSMETLAGDISFQHTIQLVREGSEKKAWRIEWEPSLIFPAMTAGDKVRVETFPAKRGEILDRNGQGLAVNGTVAQIGVVPSKLEPSSKEALAKLLRVSIDTIDKKLNAKWVQPHHFVPIALLPAGANINDYVSLPGVASQQTPMRVYPLGEAAAHLTGYIGHVSAEELERLAEDGYTEGDEIGKAGLEQVYEQQLRGKDGGRIYITDAGGKEKEEVAKQEEKDGSSITVAIDAKLQQAIYKEMGGDAGTAAAVHPATGNVLALVSSPAYDPNVFVRGVTEEQWKKWNDEPSKPLLNRFTKAYAPGSVFKNITASIGLKENTLRPDESIAISGLKWKKDASWGDYYVTRVKGASAVNLEKALLYSDNIYFAQEALKIGADKFTEAAKAFGFGEDLPVEYPFQPSQLSNEDIRSDIQLADTSYGQGEVLMTSLHVALTYAPIVSGGDIPKPVLLHADEEKQAWKKGVISNSQASLLRNSLIQVVNNPEGTGYAAKMEGVTLAGKTGTAELKKEKGAGGQENGWFVAFDSKNPTMIVAMMIEDVKTRGGSGYVTAKVKRVFEEIIR